MHNNITIIKDGGINIISKPKNGVEITLFISREALKDIARENCLSCPVSNEDWERAIYEICGELTKNDIQISLQQNALNIVGLSMGNIFKPEPAPEIYVSFRSGPQLAPVIDTDVFIGHWLQKASDEALLEMVDNLWFLDSSIVSESDNFFEWIRTRPGSINSSNDWPLVMNAVRSHGGILDFGQESWNGDDPKYETLVWLLKNRPRIFKGAWDIEAIPDAYIPSLEQVMIQELIGDLEKVQIAKVMSSMLEECPREFSRDFPSVAHYLSTLKAASVSISEIPGNYLYSNDDYWEMSR